MESSKWLFPTWRAHQHSQRRSTKSTIRSDAEGLKKKPCKNVMALVPIEPEHLRVVSQIHRLAFPDSALTKLGLTAVRRYYEWQLEGPHHHRFLGVCAGQVLLGYALGGKSNGALAGFVQKNKYFLASCLLQNPFVCFTEQGRIAIRIAFGIFRRRNRKLDAQSKPDLAQRSFSLLAIAVDPKFQSQGFGRILMEEMEKTAKSRGYCRMHLTVRVTNQKAIEFYERLGWLKSTPDSVWGGGMEKKLTRE